MKNILFIIVFAVMLLSAQFGFSALINLETPAAPSTADGKAAVDKAVGDEGKRLASNATLLTTDLIDKLQADTVAVVNLSAVSAAAPVEIVTDRKAYAIGLASVRLAQASITGSTYDFSDTTINPVLFSDKYVADNTDEFLLKLADIKGDDVAVIVAMTRTPEEIQKILQDRGVPMGNIVIVQAVSMESAAAFTGLFEEYKEGFSLRSIDRNNAVVVKALQGAV